jgi:hypothetical protein
MEQGDTAPASPDPDLEDKAGISKLYGYESQRCEKLCGLSCFDQSGTAWYTHAP